MTSPRMLASPSTPPKSARHEIDEQTGVGEVYIRSLVRTQLRLGLTVVALLVLVLGILPLLFSVDSQLVQIQIVGVPLPWVVVGGLIYPLLWAAARWHVRAAERAERDFAEIIEQS